MQPYVFLISLLHFHSCRLIMASSSEPYTTKHGSSHDRSYQRTYTSDSDPFKNFSYQPPKSQGHIRSFTRRSRYNSNNTFKMMGSRDRLGSNTSLNMLSGRIKNNQCCLNSLYSYQYFSYLILHRVNTEFVGSNSYDEYARRCKIQKDISRSYEE